MYIVDTSAFIFYSRSYPPDIDIRKWEFIGHLIKKGQLISNSIVRKEISKYGGHDYLKEEFIKKYNSIFLPLNKIINWSYNTLKDIIELDQKNHWNLIKEQDKHANDEIADPYILCQALCMNKGRLVSNTVVTSDNGLKKGCEYYKVDVIEPLDLFRRENKTF